MPLVKWLLRIQAYGLAQSQLNADDERTPGCSGVLDLIGEEYLAGRMKFWREIS
jgi:hypothetical protein